MSGTTLIGHTGFVGSNLARLVPFDHFFNSSNCEQMCGCHYQRVVCAGVAAAKWRANLDPEQDRAAIQRLMRALEQIETEQFVLISTIDVYPEPKIGGDERVSPDPAMLDFYGRHRRELEIWVAQRFPTSTILRLPAIFGPGLKKNIIFDLLHHHQLELINPATTYQWYPIERLASDLECALAAELHLANLFSEPLPTQKILDSLFPNAVVGPAELPAPSYGTKTCHAPVFGGSGGFVMPAEASLRSLRNYIQSGRW